MKHDSLQKFSLEGKTALITGAAGLLGMEHAKALLHLDAAVVLTDINSARLLAAKKQLDSEFNPENIQTQEMNVASLSSIRGVQQSFRDAGLVVDILVNNAAIDPKVDASSSMVESSRLENFSLEQWEMQISVGLTGAFLCSQVFGAVMASSGRGGVILNIASDLSVISPDQRLYQKAGLPADMQPVKPVTYSVIKAGLVGLTRYLSTYWVEQNVRCNALSPGGVENNQGQDFVDKLTSLIPMQRMAHVDEYHSIVQFLCSDASAYMNGQNIVMDGGRSVW